MNTILPLALLSIFLQFSSLLSQIPSFDWASHAEGEGGLAETLAMASDSLGNIYSAGAFVGDRDFDPATGSLQLISTNFAQGSARPDVFVQKMDKEGKLMWAFSIGTSQEDKAVDIALDKFGGVYICGYFWGKRIDLDPGPDSSFVQGGIGIRTPFLLKVDTNGNFLWGISQTNGASVNIYQGIALDDSANVYATGGFRGPADFDPDTSQFILNSQASRDIYILKLNKDGEFRWVKSIRGGGEGIGGAIKIDPSGNILLAGSFNGKTDFDPGPDSSVLTALNYDSYLLKLNSNGNFDWVVQKGGPGFERAEDLAVDDLACAYVVESGIISKYQANGSFAWDIRIPANTLAVAIDMAGNVYTTGSFTFRVDFDPGPNVENLFAFGDQDIFLAKYNANAEYVWARSIGKNGTDYGASICLDHEQNVVSGGSFSRIVDFDPDSGVVELNPGGNGGGIAPYVWKMRESWAVNIEQNLLKDHVNIYPNPATDYISLTADKFYRELEIEILDIQGRPLIHQSFSSIEAVKIDLRRLSRGMYQLKLTVNNQSSSYSFIKR